LVRCADLGAAALPLRLSHAVRCLAAAAYVERGTRVDEAEFVDRIYRMVRMGFVL